MYGENNLCARRRFLWKNIKCTLSMSNTPRTNCPVGQLFVCGARQIRFFFFLPFFFLFPPLFVCTRWKKKIRFSLSFLPRNFPTGPDYTKFDLSLANFRVLIRENIFTLARRRVRTRRILSKKTYLSSGRVWVFRRFSFFFWIFIYIFFITGHPDARRDPRWWQ